MSSYLLVVIGVTFNNTLLSEGLADVTSADGVGICNETSTCYILDDGGFIISDSRSVANVRN